MCDPRLAMGVCDEVKGPPRKKPRVSLSMKRKVLEPSVPTEDPAPTMVAPSQPSQDYGIDSVTPAVDEKSDDDVILCDGVGSTVASDPLVAPVASLYNLGNTCYMNSMLQILRFTPMFLPGLAALRSNISALEERLEKKKEEDDDHYGVSSDLKRTLNVVKNIHTMFAEMDEKEVEYRKEPTSDTLRMAVRPAALLNSLRELNPMFEGNFQHDAQELLRCVLCYIEDAEAGLTKVTQEVKKGVNGSEVKQELNGSGVEQELNGLEVTEEVSVKENGNVDQKDVCVVVIESEEEDEAVEPSGGEITDERRRSSRSVSVKGVDKEREAGPHKSKIEATDTSSTNCLKLKRKPRTVCLNNKESEKLGKDSAINATSNNCPKPKRKSRKDCLNKESEELGKDGDHTTEIAKKSQRGRKRKRTVSEEYQEASKCHDGGDAESLALPEQNKKFSSKLTKAEKEQNKNGQTIVGMFNRIRERFVGKPSRTDTESQKVEVSGDSSSTSGIMGLLPFNHIRRMGMSRFTFSRPKVKDKTPESYVTEACGQDCNDKSGMSTASPLKNIACALKNPLGSDTRLSPNKTCSRPASPCHKDNDSKSPTTLTRPGREGYTTPTKTSTTKSVVISPGSVVACDKILPVSELDDASSNNLEIRSIVDSVTKKYYSSLLGHSSPNVSTSPVTRSRKASEVNGLDCEDSRCSPTLKQTTSPTTTCVLTPGKDVVIHSPTARKERSLHSKDGALDCETRKKTNAVKALMFNTVNTHNNKELSCFNKSTLMSHLEPAPSYNTQSVQKIDRVLSSSRGPIVSPSSRVDKSSSMLLASEYRECSKENNTDMYDRIKAFRRCNSLSDSPKPCTKNSEELKPCTKNNEELKLFLKKPAATNFVSSLNLYHYLDSPPKEANTARNCDFLSVPKLQLKRCDWLGVSPVKSVSAIHALRASRSELKKVKCNIFQDLDSATNEVAVENGADNEMSSMHGKKVEKGVASPSKRNHSENEVSEDITLRMRRKRKCNKSSSQLSNGSQESSTENLAYKNSTETGNPVDLNSKKNLTSGLNYDTDFTRRLSQTQIQTRNGIVSSAVATSKHSRQSKGIDHCAGVRLKPLSISIKKCDDLLLASRPELTVTLPESERARSRTKSKVMTEEQKARIKQENGDEEALTCEDSDPAPFNVDKSTSPLVERLFGGTMMHLTRCLECENERERKEAFLDISVALRGQGQGNDSSDEEDNIEGPPPLSCLASLVRSSSSIERLREENKYWCESCLHHVEAERSCHYTELPQILSLHIKCFKAESGLFGGVSKLNDRVKIPDELPCLQHGCKQDCSTPRHRYRLFGVATHSGTSILHGHYRAYVKVQPWVSPAVHGNIADLHLNNNNIKVQGHDQSDLHLNNTKSEGQDHSDPPTSPCRGWELSQTAETSIQYVDGLWLETKQAPIGGSKLPSACVNRDMLCGGETKHVSAETLCGGQAGETKRDVSVLAAPCLGRNSSTACSKSGENERTNSDLGFQYTKSSSETNATKVNMECGDISRQGLSSLQTATTDIARRGCSQEELYFWLECDDECVRVMGPDFDSKLREDVGVMLGTPYVLFYHSLGLS